MLRVNDSQRQALAVGGRIPIVVIGELLNQCIERLQREFLGVVGQRATRPLSGNWQSIAVPSLKGGRVRHDQQALTGL